MKTLSALVFSMIISVPSFAEVWEKPQYRPDENHLPHEREEQQEKPKKQKIKKHQKRHQDRQHSDYYQKEKQN